MKQSFGRTYEELSELFRFLDACLDEHAVDEHTAFAARLALEEVFTNMVKYSTSSSDSISVEIDSDGRDLVLRLQDYDADPFDPTAHPAPDLQAPLSERRPGGLGLHLVRNLADLFEHQHVDGSNVVTLRIRMTGENETPGAHSVQ